MSVRDVDLEAMPMSIFLNDDDDECVSSGTGLFAPKTIRFLEQKFQVWNFCCLELSHSGTFAPWNFAPWYFPRE